ncbi:ATP-binding cassette domain-containing protein [bacterium]|nr:ATP-binding cassette domain-containing protein [bacterium]
MPTNTPLLEIKNLCISHKKGGDSFLAVQDLSLTIYKGETVALVGESGCGKTSVAWAILRLLKKKSGTILYKGQEKLSRKEVQMIFQDPYSSLNPRMTIEEIIEEPLIVYKIGSQKERKERVEELLEQVSLPKHYKYRYPHELSGGERQRISIARALAPKPKLVICDEPTHALDVSVQASIINLLKDLKEALSLSLLFISHDLSLVRNISDRCLVMYKGQIVETGSIEAIFTTPLHPFTQKLLSCIPEFGKKVYIDYEAKEEEKVIPSEPLEVASPLLQNYVENLQHSITQLKHTIESHQSVKKCPYLEICKSKNLKCHRLEKKGLPATFEHKSLCSTDTP